MRLYAAEFENVPHHGAQYSFSLSDKIGWKSEPGQIRKSRFPGPPCTCLPLFLYTAMFITLPFNYR